MTPNNALERTAGSHSLAAAAQRERSPHGDRILMREGINGSGASKTSSDRQRRGEATSNTHGAGVDGPGSAAIGATRRHPRTTVGAERSGADAGRRRQADRQRGVHAHGREPSGHRGASRAGESVLSEKLRGVEPASRAGAGNGRRRCKARRPAPLTGTFGAPAAIEVARGRRG